MKRISKLLICTMCIIAMIVPTFGTVSASIYDVVFELTSLGVLDDMEKEADLSTYITRDKFAKLVVNAMGYSDISETMRDKGYFSDVSSTPYVGAINLLYELKILSGTGVGTFSPDAYVTYPQVGKIMVNVLGYSNIVNGADLNAYFYQAGALGVYNDVNSAGEYVTYNDAYIIIKNCLDIDVMTQNFGLYGSGSYEVLEGNTLKSFLQTAQHHKMTKKRGIVTADRVTYLNSEKIAKNKTDIIEIDGEALKCNFTIPQGLVGMAVDYYIEYTEGESGIVTSIQASSKNKVVEFNLDDYVGASSGELEYLDNDNTVKLKYDEATDIIYNNRIVNKYTAEDIANFKNGTVKVIDNDEDEILDVIYIYDYKDAVVERLYPETKQLYFANNQMVDGLRYLSLDDEEIIVNIVNADGSKLSFDEIPVDSVVSIAKSNDKKVVTVVVSDKKVTEKVNIIEDEYVTIGSNVYKCADGIYPEVGKHVDAYINFMNKIIYIEETISYDNYAYVMKASNPSSSLDNVKVSMITPGYISETRKDSIADDGASETSKKLFFRNKGETIYNLAEKVTVDGTKYASSKAAEKILNQVVSYALNSNGEVSKVEIIPPVDNDPKKTYNENGKLFSKGSTYGFGIDESKTMSICVPNNAGASDDDLLVPVMLLNGQEYTIKAYDVDEVSSIAGLVVINATMQAGQSGIVTASSDVGMVKRVSRKIENGEEHIVVNLLTKDGEKNYFVSNLIPNSAQFTTLGAGDLIQYSLVEGNDELNGFALIQDSNFYTGAFQLDVGLAYETCLGTVVDCKYNYVSKEKSRWTDNVTINYGGATAVYEVYMTGTPPIYLLEDDNKIKTLTFDDIQIGDKIFVSANVGVVRAIVVRR